MAKTFKTAPALPATPAKPISERDFFDLTDEPVAEPVSRQRGNKQTPTSTAGATKTGADEKARRSGNNSNTGNTAGAGPVTGLPEAEERDVRQTFVVSSAQLEQLRDFVHARRVQGDYEYSQKQALQEALALLFASVPPAPPRPSQTRQSEQRRRDRIIRGRRTGAAE